jgi:hypothetical protein
MHRYRKKTVGTGSEIINHRSGRMLTRGAECTLGLNEIAAIFV